MQKSGKVVVVEKKKVVQRAKPKVQLVLKNKPKVSRKVSSPKGQGKSLSELDYFIQHLTCPDLFGPCPIPILGGGAKTVGAMDRTIITLGGSSTNVVIGIGMANVSYGEQYRLLTATSSTTSLTQGSGAAAATQFPSASQLDDVQLIAACLTISYIGAPLSAAGEVLLGSISLDNSTSGGFAVSSYASLSYLNSVLRVPIASLVDKPQRVFLTKRSPDADAFYAATASAVVPDVFHPFILTNGLPVGQSVNIEITRTWQATSLPGSNEVPFAEAAPSFSSDISTWQDAVQTVGQLTNYVMDAIPTAWADHVMEWSTGAMQKHPAISSAVATGFGFLTHSAFQNHLGGRRRARP